MCPADIISCSLSSSNSMFIYHEVVHRSVCFVLPGTAVWERTCLLWCWPVWWPSWGSSCCSRAFSGTSGSSSFAWSSLAASTLYWRYFNRKIDLVSLFFIIDLASVTNVLIWAMTVWFNCPSCTTKSYLLCSHCTVSSTCHNVGAHTEPPMFL